MSRSSSSADRLQLASFRQENADPEIVGGAAAIIRHWTGEFLMSDHPELGRDGNVCPFTAFGARIDTLRFGASEAPAYFYNCPRAGARRLAELRKA